MEFTDDRKDLFTAMAKAQGEFTTVEKGKDNPFFKSKYAPLDSIIEMIRPILAAHGLSVMQFTDIPESGTGVIIETVIAHSTGQYVSGRLLMPMAKVDPQGAGSSITYGRRYALAAALGIVSDEDVDGNGNEVGKGQGKKTQPPMKTETMPHATLTPTQEKYFPRIKTALDTLFADDVTQKKALIKSLTAFTNKDGKQIPGIEDYRRKDGKGLEILCHTIEKMVTDGERLPVE